MGIAKIHHKNIKKYLFFAQYTEIIQFWIIEISGKFSLSRIVDSFTIRAPKEKINNARLSKKLEIVVCLGHHLDLKFAVFDSFVEKNTGKINRGALLEEARKMDWIAVETGKKKDAKKMQTQKIQVILKLWKNRDLWKKRKMRKIKN